jgi:hypothetical protein
MMDEKTVEREQEKKRERSIHDGPTRGQERYREKHELAGTR